MLKNHDKHANTHFQIFPLADRTQRMRFECKKLVNESKNWLNLDTAASKTKYDTHGGIDVTNTINSNFYILSLFTRVTDHGIIYSLPANFRRGLTENLTNHINFQESLLDHAYGSNEDIFSNSPLNILFFQEKQLSYVTNIHNRDLDKARMTSLGLETIKVAEENINEVSVKIDRIGIVPSHKELLKIAYIMNLKIGKPQNHGEARPNHLDYCSILSEFQDVRILNQKNLNEFVYNKLNWTFFNMQDNNFKENLWRVRSFFQSLHPIGISFVEGNHRSILANKLLYGINLDLIYPLSEFFMETPFKGEMVPKKPKSKESNIGEYIEEEYVKNYFGPAMVPASSPLHSTKMEIKVLIVQEMQDKYEKHFIGPDMLDIAKKEAKRQQETNDL